mmetsp:Transcript_96168/g.170699  ORF Transcript_96168/g.170699 Transcript_96168/m.170699 type:complete len:85 (+) Transcript_96168:201-455(+)
MSHGPESKSFHDWSRRELAEMEEDVTFKSVFLCEIFHTHKKQTCFYAMPRQVRSDLLKPGFSWTCHIPSHQVSLGRDLTHLPEY